MEKFSYLESLFVSVKDVFKKPILLIPFLLSIVLGVVFEIWNAQFTDEPLKYVLLMGLGIGSLFIIGYIVYFLVSVLFTGMGLAVMRQHVENKDTSVGMQVKEGGKLYFRLIGFMVIQALMIAIPILLVMLLFVVSLAPVINVGLLIVSLIIAIIVLVYLVFLALSYFYVNINIAYGKGVIDAIKFSFRAMKNNVKHIVFSILCVLLLALIIISVIAVISLIFGAAVVLSDPDAATNMPPAYQLIFSAITSLIMMPFSAAIALYIFKSFKALPNKKPEFYPKVK